MGIFDKIVDAGEDLLDSGEKVLGKAVDAGTDLVGDGLRAVGLDGAADAVEDFGDSVADQLGATPDEKSLDETDDPKELVHGDVGALRDRASSLTTMAGSLDDGGSGLRGISVGDWTGEAADGYHEKTAAEFPKWFTAADACEAASSALTALAGAVDAAQTQAAEAVRLWKEAQRQHDAWVDDVNRRTDAYNAAADAYNAGATDVKPTMPTFGPDPGPAVKQQANDVLRRARSQRNAAADDAAGALHGAAGQAPPLPAAGDRLLDSIGDYAQAADIARQHFGVGLVGVATDTVKMLRTVNPTDPYNQAHPAEYLKNSTQLGAGLVHAAAHPKELVKGFIGTGWSKDPAQASGALTANIMSLAAPGPKGAGALSGAGRAAGAAGRDAATTAASAARSATTSGARDAAAVAGRGLTDARPSIGKLGDIGDSRAATPSSAPSAGAPRSDTPVAGHQETTAPAKAEPTTQPVSHHTDPGTGRDSPTSDTNTSHTPDADGQHPGHTPDEPAAAKPEPDQSAKPEPAQPTHHDGDTSSDRDTGTPRGDDARQPVHDSDPTPARDPDGPPPRTDDAPTPHDGDGPPLRDVDRGPVHDGDPAPPTTTPHGSGEPAPTPHAGDAPDAAAARDPGPAPVHESPAADTGTPVASTRPASIDTAPPPPHPQAVHPSSGDGRSIDTRPVDSPRSDTPRTDPTPPAAGTSQSAVTPRGDGPGLSPRPGDAVGQTPGRLADGPSGGQSTPAHHGGRPDQPTAGAVAPKTVDPAGSRPRSDGGASTRESSAGSGGRTDGGGDQSVFTPKETLTPNSRIDHDNPHSSLQREECTVAGEPVDVATGEYFLPATDVDLPGILPLTLVRTHRSGFRGGQWFGSSWTSTFDSRLLVDDDGITTVDPDGVVLRFPRVEGDDVVVAERGALSTLRRTPVGGYVLTDRTGSRRHWFDPKPQLGGVDVAAGAFALSAITDRNHNRILFGYSDKGVPVSVEHSGGYRIAVDTADARIVRYRLITLDDDGVASTTLREFGYTDGDLTSVTTAVGATTHFAYDEHRIVGWTDSIGQTYENVYDPEGRVVFQSGTDGVWAGRFDYRDLPDGTGTVTAVTHALGATTFYAIDVDGRPQRVVDPVGRETVTRWDVRRNPISTTDPSGATTAFDHDDNGDLVRVTGPSGDTTTVAYLRPGLPARITRADGGVETIRYDERGNAVEVTDPAGATRRIDRASNGAPAVQVDPDGRRVLVETNAAGLPVRVEDAQGHATAVEYDTFGRPVRITAPDGAVTRREYDLEGRLTTEVAADGGVERWLYDGEGNRVSHVDAAGAETRWEYGLYDLPLARVDADGSRTEFEYDTTRRLVAVVNALGQRWTYDYQADGRVAREVDFSGAETTFGYDAVGRLAWKQNGAGQRIDYTYDAAGNLVGERSGDDEVVYERDALGRMVSVSNLFGRAEFGHDALGRVVSEAWNGEEVVSAWSAAGDLLRRSMPSGSTVGFSYDPSGALAGVDVDGRAIELTRDSMGRETRRTVGAVAIDSAWDAVGRLTRRAVVEGIADAGRLNLSLGGPSAERTTSASTFGYRPDGALLSVTGEGPATENLLPRARFDLDDAGRVRAVAGDDRTVREAFSFDANHNIVGSVVDGERHGWEYRDGRLVDDGRCTYGYDGAGRVTQIVRRRLSRKPDVWQYGWDAWDRLRWAVDPTGRRWGYEYDPMGRRTAKIADNGSRVVFRWSGTQLVEQFDESTGEVITWVYEPGGMTPVAQVSGRAGSRPAGGLLNLAESDDDAANLPQSEVDRRFFAIVTDQIGMPVGLLDPVSGELAGRAITTLWGESTWTGESTPLRFPGQYADDESGLFYNLFRYYHPGSGRYLTPDPLGLAPAPNPYAYPENPTTAADPLGLMPCPEVAGSETVKRWGPHEAGPLDPTLASTFRGGSYYERVTTEPMVLYRAFTEGKFPLGRFWSRDFPAGPIQARMDSALNPAWGNEATAVSRIEVPAGTRYFEGSVAPQDVYAGGVLHGGGNQIVFQPGFDVPLEWLR